MRKFIKQGKQLVSIDTKASRKFANIQAGQSGNYPYYEHVKDINYLTDDYEVVINFKTKTNTQHGTLN